MNVKETELISYRALISYCYVALYTLFICLRNKEGG